MLYWLSFADPGRPKGQQFMGVCIVEPASEYSNSFMGAVAMSHRLGINPGGEVRGYVVPFKVPLDLMNRLLSKSDLAAHEHVWGKVVSLKQLRSEASLN